MWDGCDGLINVMMAFLRILWKRRWHVVPFFLILVLILIFGYFHLSISGGSFLICDDYLSFSDM